MNLSDRPFDDLRPAYPDHLDEHLDAMKTMKPSARKQFERMDQIERIQGEREEMFRQLDRVPEWRIFKRMKMLSKIRESLAETERLMALVAKGPDWDGS